MNNCYQKSTLRAYTQAEQTLETNENFSFQNARKTGVSIDFTPGSTQVTLSKAGLYLVSFDAFGIESGTAGNLVAQLYNNGKAVEGAIDSSTSASATEVGNLHFSTIIEVLPNCCAVRNTANLSVKNTGVGVVYGNANLSIVKLA